MSRLLTIALLLGLLAANGGCARQHSPETIRIGINAWPTYEFLYLAQQKGIFAQEGVDVRIIEFNSLADALNAYVNGQVDGLGSTVVELLMAKEYASRPPQALLALDYSNGADVVVARQDIVTAKDLRGRRIGVELGSLGAYVLDRLLESTDLAYGDVTVVSADQLTMEAQFARGELDAVITYPPISIRLVSRSDARVIFTSSDIPNELLDIVFMRRDFVDQYPDDMRRIRKAYYRAVEYARRFPTESFAILAAREGITPEEFESALHDGIELIPEEKQTTYLEPNGIVATTAARTNRILVKSRQLNHTFPPEDLVWNP